MHCTLDTVYQWHKTFFAAEPIKIWNNILHLYNILKEWDIIGCSLHPTKWNNFFLYGSYLIIYIYANEASFWEFSPEWQQTFELFSLQIEPAGRVCPSLPYTKRKLHGSTDKALYRSMCVCTTCLVTTGTRGRKSITINWPLLPL